MDKNRKSGDLYQFDAWVWIEDATKVGNFVFRFYANNLPVNPTNGSWIEGWVWQFNGMEDIDSTKEGKQTLQTGWNHVIKDVQEMGAIYRLLLLMRFQSMTTETLTIKKILILLHLLLLNS